MLSPVHTKQHVALQVAETVSATHFELLQHAAATCRKVLACWISSCAQLVAESHRVLNNK